MPEGEQLSSLIADIYDTILNGESWPQVLARICEFIPGCGSNLFSQNTLYNIAQVHYSCGDNPHYVQLYLDKYVNLNPFFPAIAFDEVGRVGVQSDVVPFDEFHQTRFYREWCAPQGYVDCLYCVLDKSETGCAMITVRRNKDDGLVDNEACRRMRLVVPHVRRAVLISRALEHSQATSANLTELFDRMSAAIFFVGSGGRIAYANVAGERLLSQNDVLIRRMDSLVILDPRAAAALNSIVLVSDHDADHENAAPIPLTGKNGESYFAHILPLTSGLRRQVADGYAARAAVFIRKAKLGWASPAELVAKAYRLTSSEIRVLYAVAEEEGIGKVAELLGISAETVRTHLRHIFEKTGKRRQADLIKLLAEFANAKL
jgi:DNA-binding CsgD family transcriptional regulator